jgi:hypothetical protein
VEYYQQWRRAGQGIARNQPVNGGNVTVWQLEFLTAKLLFVRGGFSANRPVQSHCQ